MTRKDLYARDVLQCLTSKNMYRRDVLQCHDKEGPVCKGCAAAFDKEWRVQNGCALVPWQGRACMQGMCASVWQGNKSKEGMCCSVMAGKGWFVRHVFQWYDNKQIVCRERALVQWQLKMMLKREIFLWVFCVCLFACISLHSHRVLGKELNISVRKTTTEGTQ